MQQGLQDFLFERVDESDDGLFYAEPRRVVHIDAEAIQRIGELFRELLPTDGVLLDLMSSWRSHLPPDCAKKKMIGLGLNATEMRENPQLDGHVVHDINRDPVLPFPADSFDGVILTVSVQYLTRPVETFREVSRVLRPGAPLVVTFSNRMFPTKAVRVWQASGDAQRMTLVKLYFQKAGGFEGVTAQDRSPALGRHTDPVFLVTARKGAPFTLLSSG